MTNILTQNTCVLPEFGQNKFRFRCEGWIQTFQQFLKPFFGFKGTQNGYFQRRLKNDNFTITILSLSIVKM